MVIDVVVVVCSNTIEPPQYMLMLSNPYNTMMISLYPICEQNRNPEGQNPVITKFYIALPSSSAIIFSNSQIPL